ncbi:MAG: hypothetical protein OER88_13185 [Planctomycetota bacterium]|nr:hypothetical protein [Planctomycetota bacterium]
MAANKKTARALRLTQFGTVEPDSVKTIVLYDRKTGRIVHTHTVACFNGASAPTKAALEKRATAVAKECGHAVSRTACLHVAGDGGLKPGVLQKVDTKKLVIVAADGAPKKKRKKKRKKRPAR